MVRYYTEYDVTAPVHTLCVLYDEYRTGGAFDPPTQNTINVYKVQILFREPYLIITHENQSHRVISCAQYVNRLIYVHGVCCPCTVEPLIKDTLNKGHLCIKDTFNLYSGSTLLPLKEDNLSKLSVPMCPLFRGSTVQWNLYSE